MPLSFSHALPLLLAFTVTGCIPDKITSQNVSDFGVYTFKQTAALGFCANPELLFSANITRAQDGTMTFAHSTLERVGTDNSQCGDTFEGYDGCYAPKSKPTRTLSPKEALKVGAVFSEVSFFKRPDPICREVGIDPCNIERHTWDGSEKNNFICGADRLSVMQAQDLRNLFFDLQEGR
jgi:hypothetical protein